MAAFPIFFSVSASDTPYAEKLFECFPDDWIYLWSKSGKEGVDLWQEIEKEQLPYSKMFVVFWSKNYLNSENCIKELEIAAEMKRQSAITPLVIRLDHHPISYSKNLRQKKRDFQTFGTLLSHRTSKPQCNLDSAEKLVQEVGESVLERNLPKLARPHVQEGIKRASKQSTFKYRPGLWISGFNGIGRRTESIKFVSELSPNAICYEVRIDETTVIKQATLRLQDQIYRFDEDELRSSATSESNDPLAELENLVLSTTNAGNYVIFRDDLNADGFSLPPNWFDDLALKLEYSSRPKIILITQAPLFGERYNEIHQKVGYYRVPTLDDAEASELTASFIASMSSDPNLLDEDLVEDISRKGFGNASLLKALVKAVVQDGIGESLDKILSANTERISASVSAYVRMALEIFENKPDHLRTIYLLNEVSPLTSADIGEIVQPKTHLSLLLKNLQAFGIVEREGDHLYRTTPLLNLTARHTLSDSDLKAWSRQSVKLYAELPIEAIEGSSYLQIETKIQASLDTNSEVPERLKTYVMSAHLFRAGVRAYNGQRYFQAYELLYKAFNNRNELTESSKIELYRYLGLSAVRTEQPATVAEITRILSSNFNHREMAHFLRGFEHEHYSRFDLALDEFKNSLKVTNKNKPQLIHLYRHLTKCSLKTPHPDFNTTLYWAEAGLNISENPGTLYQTGSVALHWLYRSKPSPDIASHLNERIQKIRSKLYSVSDGLAEYFMLEAEEASLKDDLKSAISAVEKIPSNSLRIHHRIRRWNWLSASSDTHDLKKCIDELSEFKRGYTNRELFRSNEYHLTEMFIRSHLSLKKDFRSALDRFSDQLEPRQIGSLVKKVRRQLETSKPAS